MTLQAATQDDDDGLKHTPGMGHQLPECRLASRASKPLVQLLLLLLTAADSLTMTVVMGAEEAAHPAGVTCLPSPVPCTHTCMWSVQRAELNHHPAQRHH
jgi:hypothetical protein